VLRNRSVVARALSALLDLALPPRCAACDLPAWSSQGLCALCAARVPPPVARCRRCGRPTGPFARQAPCARCTDDDRRLDGVVAAHDYAGVARDLVLALKFRGRAPAALLLGRAVAERIRAYGVPGDLVVPVPLSGRRRRQRGYDQAVLLARVVGRELGLDTDVRALRRRRHTPPQVGLSRSRRRRGPRGAFRARRSRVRGRSVLLVDDVLTSGATAGACAVALRRAGTASVVAAVACRAP
jgi:ComF family protein